MDETIKTAVEYVDYIQSIRKQKELLQLKKDRKLVIAYNEGLFRATPELIMFAKTYEDMNYDYMIVEDMNGNPIKIELIADFIVTLQERYHEVMNQYYVDYEKIKTTRTIESLLDE